VKVLLKTAIIGLGNIGSQVPDDEPLYRFEPHPQDDDIRLLDCVFARRRLSLAAKFLSERLRFRTVSRRDDNALTPRREVTAAQLANLEQERTHAPSLRGSFTFKHERCRLDILIERIRRVRKSALRIGTVKQLHGDVEHHNVCGRHATA
jgi:hypothetical protein